MAGIDAHNRMLKNKPITIERASTLPLRFICLSMDFRLLSLCRWSQKTQMPQNTRINEKVRDRFPEFVRAQCESKKGMG